jgi:chromosome segregation ATPase
VNAERFLDPNAWPTSEILRLEAEVERLQETERLYEEAMVAFKQQIARAEIAEGERDALADRCSELAQWAVDLGESLLVAETDFSQAQKRLTLVETSRNRLAEALTTAKRDLWVHDPPVSLPAAQTTGWNNALVAFERKVREALDG